MKQLFFWGIILLQFSIYAQEVIPFTFRKQENLKGGLKIIGNNILSDHPANQPFDSIYPNDYSDMRYIDIDNDANTFSSSAATLSFTNSTCSKIRYAGLYWGGMYVKNDDSKKNIRIKIPSNPNYIDIQADSYIYNNHTSAFRLGHNPYICYKDVTDLLSEGTPSGEYIVANVKATQSNEGYVSGGTSAGWALVIIYEDPMAPSKHITTFDGYASVSRPDELNNPTDVEFSFSGFKTLPAPLPVNARFGVIALEGDKLIQGDKLSVQKPDLSYFDLYTDVNPSNNFFNSSISYENEIDNNRRPNSKNTLGWDIDLFSIPNENNSIITNDQTSAKFKAYTTQDKFDIFFSAFEVEVIEPKMNLLKTVEDATGNVLNNQTIPLGTTFYYGLEFQNVGNDDAEDYQIIDVLPRQVRLSSPFLVEIPQNSGITYSVTTNAQHQTQITFTIPNRLAVQNGEKCKIRFAVKLEDDCDVFMKPCSEIVANKAYSVYRGKLNNSLVNDNGSFSSVDVCNLGIIESTLFYADVSSCDLTKYIDDLLCGENLIITATDGFDSYQWKNERGQILGNEQHLMVSVSGSYTVEKRKENCLVRKEVFNVSTVQRQQENPLIPYAGHTFECTSTEKSFPQLFLCGATASKTIDITHIANVKSVEVKKYDGASVDISATCPPAETESWVSVFNQKQFTLYQEGIYQISLTFHNDCVATYYFRVHTSNANLHITSRNIACSDGMIRIENAPDNYEFAVALSSDTTKTFDRRTEFIINKAGEYTVYARKINRLEADCEIVVEKIQITQSEQKLEIVSVNNESCSNQNDGSLSFKVTGGTAPYNAHLKNNNTGITHSITDIYENTLSSFDNLPPADYVLTVNDTENCQSNHNFTINPAILLDFTVTNELTCQNNTSMSRLVLTFANTDLDLTKVSYQINGQGNSQFLEEISGNTAYIYPSIETGNNQYITVEYSNCNLTRNFDYQSNTPLILSKDSDPTLISAFRIKVKGGTGSYTYYINGIKQDSPTYHLHSSDQGYKDALGREIKKIQVRVEDELGCFVEQIFEEVFFDIKIPNFFTPDGDGINDVWKIENALAYKKMRIHIYDRNGREITVLTPATAWDGTLNNAPLPSGDYWFKLDFNDFRDKRTYIGHFSLYR